MSKSNDNDGEDTTLSKSGRILLDGLKRARVKKGTLAKAINMDPGQLSHVLRGRKITFENTIDLLRGAIAHRVFTTKGKHKDYLNAIASDQLTQEEKDTILEEMAFLCAHPELVAETIIIPVRFDVVEDRDGRMLSQSHSLLHATVAKSGNPSQEEYQQVHLLRIAIPQLNQAKPTFLHEQEQVITIRLPDPE